jgi:hypothetical protein
VPRRSDYSNNGKVFCIGAENIRKYYFSLQYKKPRKVTMDFIIKNKLQSQLDNELLLTQNFSNTFPVCLKPKGFLPDGTSVIIKPIDESLDLKLILLILNSRFIQFFLNRYLQNYGVLTNNISSFVTKRIPLIIPNNIDLFKILCSYMIAVNRSEEIRNKYHYIIEFLDKQLIDSLVYELYFKEKFEEDGLKTNLIELVGPYLEDIEKLKSDDEKLKTIRKVVEKIKNDEKVMKEIEKIKNHKWVKIIEGRN